MSAKRRDIAPVMRAKEAWDYLGGEVVVRDFIKAGLLKPCCMNKPNSAPGRRIVFYRRGDVERCAHELLEGRYPKSA